MGLKKSREITWASLSIAVFGQASVTPGQVFILCNFYGITWGGKNRGFWNIFAPLVPRFWRKSVQLLLQGEIKTTWDQPLQVNMMAVKCYYHIVASSNSRY